VIKFTNALMCLYNKKLYLSVTSQEASFSVAKQHDCSR